MMSKQQIRSDILVKLQKMKKEERLKQIEKVITIFLQQDEYRVAKNIGITISKFPEFDTHFLIKKMIKDGKHVYCPLTKSNYQMDFIEINSSTKFIISDFGIKEPLYNNKLINNQVDLLIVPGLAYSIDMNQRIGFGGGYYDRFLSQFKGDTLSLAFKEQIFHDIEWTFEPTDHVINKIIYTDC